MNILHLGLAFIAGVGLGLFYFGTQWLTLQYLPKIRRPELLTLGGFFIRMGITLLGFYFIMGGRWERLLIALGGFVLARFFLARKVKKGQTDHIRGSKWKRR